MPVAHADEAQEDLAAQREGRQLLLDTRVSRILDSHGAALGTLIEHGFSPLANPAMRFALAHTVTLGQAIRLRGLSEAEQDAVLTALVALGVPGRLAASQASAEREG